MKTKKTKFKLMIYLKSGQTIPLVAENWEAQSRNGLIVGYSFTGISPEGKQVMLDCDQIAAIVSEEL